MSSITFDRFDGGLDVRRGASVSDANRLRVLENAYVTPGRGIQKRPCLSLVATLENGTKGLKAAGGKLNTFYSIGIIAHANPLFQANYVPHPTAATGVAKVHFVDVFLGFVYAAIEYADASLWHHYLDGTVASKRADQPEIERRRQFLEQRFRRPSVRAGAEQQPRPEHMKRTEPPIRQRRLGLTFDTKVEVAAARIGPHR